MLTGNFRWKSLCVGLAVAAVLGSVRAEPASSAVPALTLKHDDKYLEERDELIKNAIRGITIGPIENSLHPDRGYGSLAYQQTLDEAVRMGASWVSLTPFGRVWDLTPSGISQTFEAPYESNRKALVLAIRQAHQRGLKVMLVPHLWVETGGWRAEIEPENDRAWQAWAEAYRRFVLGWADTAELAHADIFALGVELRSWVTTTRTPLFLPIIREVRRHYSGLLTYAANWDDAESTTIWGELDLIGINAFYPLAQKDGASPEVLRAGAQEVAAGVQKLATTWGKPVIFTEFGYTTRSNPAVRPWEWPEHLGRVEVNELAQAEAYHALLGAFMDQKWFAGFFVWRFYADPNDTSQEPAWGFSPRAKLAESVLREAFSTRFAGDADVGLGSALLSRRALPIGVY